CPIIPHTLLCQLLSLTHHVDPTPAPGVALRLRLETPLLTVGNSNSFSGHCQSSSRTAAAAAPPRTCCPETQAGPPYPQSYPFSGTHGRLSSNPVCVAANQSKEQPSYSLLSHAREHKGPSHGRG